MAETRRLKSPGVHFPPPFIYAGVFLVGLAIERWVVRLRLSAIAPRNILVTVGWIAAAIGVAFAASGVITFRRHRTAIIPFHPASELVRSGPYRITRNPMYVGLATLYAGLTLIFDLGVPLLLLPIGIAMMQTFVIHREERYMTDAFGDAYRVYKRDVRRWL